MFATLYVAMVQILAQNELQAVVYELFTEDWRLDKEELDKAQVCPLDL